MGVRRCCHFSSSAYVDYIYDEIPYLRSSSALSACRPLSKFAEGWMIFGNSSCTPWPKSPTPWRARRSLAQNCEGLQPWQPSIQTWRTVALIPLQSESHLWLLPLEQRLQVRTSMTTPGKGRRVLRLGLRTPRRQSRAQMRHRAVRQARALASIRVSPAGISPASSRSLARLGIPRRLPKLRRLPNILLLIG